MRFLTLALLTILSFQSFALTEAEEFELYKEFKAKKQARQTTNSTKNASEDNQPVNVIINNNNYGESKQGTVPNYKKSLAIYESSRKNPWVGVGLAYVFPTAGHFYANDWGRGLKFAIAEAIGIGIILNAYKNEDECSYYYYYGDDYNYCYKEKVYNEDQALTGATIYIIAKVWELFDAYRAVEDYNTKLKQGLDLAYGFDPYYNMTVGLTYRF
jgi:hypothetical protein